MKYIVGAICEEKNINGCSPSEIIKLTGAIPVLHSVFRRLLQLPLINIYKKKKYLSLQAGLAQYTYYYFHNIPCRFDTLHHFKEKIFNSIYWITNPPSTTNMKKYYIYSILYSHLHGYFRVRIVVFDGNVVNGEVFDVLNVGVEFEGGEGAGCSRQLFFEGLHVVGVHMGIAKSVNKITRLKK